MRSLVIRRQKKLQTFLSPKLLTFAQCVLYAQFDVLILLVKIQCSSSISIRKFYSSVRQSYCGQPAFGNESNFQCFRESFNFAKF